MHRPMSVLISFILNAIAGLKMLNILINAYINVCLLLCLVLIYGMIDYKELEIVSFFLDFIFLLEAVDYVSLYL